MTKFFKNCLISSSDSTPVDQSSSAPRAVAQFSSRTRYNDNNHDTSLESLCQECRAIDWPNLTDLRKFKLSESLSESLSVCPNGRHRDPVRAYEKKSRNQLLNSSCRVCRFVGSLVNFHSGSRALNQSLDLGDQPMHLRRGVPKSEPEGLNCQFDPLGMFLREERATMNTPAP
ncbi:uncharacterized protein EAF02_009644 [Botrytis sinoallii]|uniref:uncharacterized protein n=1 Tax=Botrytis sinoallii TaxID=1463999 RepID=UPI001901511D|nr:uncharacterized protein EAF02_009644 [Botrytis sinoallii]KAF7867453.1 hypothetical protein EAF02_009644 [Botrytis sinoallii]